MPKYPLRRKIYECNSCGGYCSIRTRENITPIACPYLYAAVWVDIHGEDNDGENMHD